jgi:hypothetical protein
MIQWSCPVQQRWFDYTSHPKKFILIMNTTVVLWSCHSTSLQNPDCCLLITTCVRRKTSLAPWSLHLSRSVHSPFSSMHEMLYMQGSSSFLHVENPPISYLPHLLCPALISGKCQDLLLLWALLKHHVVLSCALLFIFLLILLTQHSNIHYSNKMQNF